MYFYRGIFALFIILLSLIAIEPCCCADSVIDAYYHNAQDYYNKGDYPAALSSINDALNYKPTNIEYRQLKGSILEKIGRARDAQQQYDHVSDFQTREAKGKEDMQNLLEFDTNKRMGVSECKAQHWLEARSYLQKAHDINPSDAEVNNLLDYINQGKYFTDTNPSKYIDNQGKIWNPKSKGAAIKDPLLYEENPVNSNSENQKDGSVDTRSTSTNLPSYSKDQNTLARPYDTSSSSLSNKQAQQPSSSPLKSQYVKNSRDESTLDENGQRYGSIPPDNLPYNESNIDPVCIDENNRGVQQYKEGQYQAALDSLDSALKTCQEYFIAYQNKGHTLNKAERYKEAMQVLNTIKDADQKYHTENAITYNNLGFAQYKYGKAVNDINYLYDAKNSLNRSQKYASPSENASITIKTNIKIVDNEIAKHQIDNKVTSQGDQIGRSSFVLSWPILIAIIVIGLVAVFLKRPTSKHQENTRLKFPMRPKSRLFTHDIFNIFHTKGNQKEENKNNADHNDPEGQLNLSSIVFGNLKQSQERSARRKMRK